MVATLTVCHDTSLGFARALPVMEGSRATRCSHGNKMPISEGEIVLLTDSDGYTIGLSVCLVPLNLALKKLKMKLWGYGPGVTECSPRTCRDMD